MNKLIAILIVSIMALPAIAMVSAASPIPIVDNVSVTMPSNVYTGQSFTVYVNNSIGFSNYTTEAFFSGENLTGFSPTSTFENYGGSNPSASFSVTAPLSPQTIYIAVITSALYHGQYVNYSHTFAINVYNPITLRATITNSQAFAINNVVVSFVLNGNLYGTKTVNLSPDSSQVVTLELLSTELGTGSYTLTVSVNNPLIKVNGGTQSSSVTFYNGTPPNYDWIYYVAAGVFIFMVILVLGSGRRPNRPSNPKWRR